MKASSKVRNLKVPILLAILLFTSAIFLTSTAVKRTAADGTSGSSSTGTTTFTNFELAGDPFATGFSVGTTCPNTSGNCKNNEGEPQIRADRAGNFYASSENVLCVIGGLCGGTFAWKSTDAGLHYTTLPLPNSVSSGRVGFSPAGGDTDIAVAPQTNANGFFNVYVASLQTTPPLANVFVSTSKDGGSSWSINPTSATIPVDDREWIAADGANKVCISYHAISATNDIFVNCSFDAGSTFTQTGNAFDAAHIAFLAGFDNRIGNLAIDANNHVIYTVFTSIANAAELTCLPCNFHTVWIAVSIDGGKTFTDHIVYNNPDVTVSYGHQFPNVSVDKAGNVYAVFSDNHNLFYSFSQDFGNTWSTPVQVNGAPSNTAIFPWSVAGSAGLLDLVWYGTSFFDGVTIPDNYPSTAAWYVFFAQNLLATTPGSSFTQVIASPIVHFGGVCESGTTCTGNRDLLDDFGVAASPVTGFASIIYTDDQLTNAPNEPVQPRCVTSNTVRCTHTNIATQISGSSIFKKAEGFEIEREELEEINNEPEFDLAMTNTANFPIISISVQINGLNLPLTWNPALPVQPGQLVSASTKILPLGFLPALAGIYPVTITATFSDGSALTRTSSVIYTLNPLQLP